MKKSADHAIRYSFKLSKYDKRNRRHIDKQLKRV